MKLYGKIPVIERLKSNPKSIRKIYVQEGNDETAYIRKKAKKWRIPVFCVPRTKIIKMGRSLNTQGIIVEVEEYAYVPFEDILKTARKKRETIVFLDGLNDPQNLGGIIRSLACLGGFSIVLPTHGSVGITEAVLRVSAGGDNFVKVARVSNLNQAVVKAKAAGFWIAGTVVKKGKELPEIDLPFPLAIVIGAEQKGIRDIIKKNLDLELTVSMAQQSMAMNAAHATTIFCYEITRQKKQRK